MKHSFKKTSLIMASALLLAATPVVAYAVEAPAAARASASPLTVKPIAVSYNFDGQELTLPSGLLTFAYQGTTYVPVRFVSYALQKNVQWDNKAKKLKITEPSTSEKVAIREKLINAVASAPSTASAKSVRVLPISASYEVEGKKQQVPAGQFSFSHDGTLYVPLRFIAEVAGVDIAWNGKEQKITGRSAAYVSSQPSDNAGGTPSAGGQPTTGETKPSTPTTGEPAATGTPAGGTAGGGSAAAPGAASYASITSAAEAELNALNSRSRSELLSLVQQYLRTSNTAEKQRLLAQGESKLSGFTSEFEGIVSRTESQLKAGGHDTSIISQYRDRFNSEIAAGRALAASMAN